jgi:hypothetical protein
MQLTFRKTAAHLCAAALAAFSILSCSQYEYSSTSPGVLEVRLAVKNTRTDLLPFTVFDSTQVEGSSMFFVMKSLEAVDVNEVHLPVFSDIYAIRRNPDGDFFNALEVRARDSMTVLGATWSPPQTYTSLELVIDSPSSVFISFGFYGSFIPVDPVLPYQALRQLEGMIPVESGKTTLVTVTFDLDRSLIQRTETFLFVPVFYISSVQIL